MFKKILIANRGEIACRVIRTAKRMGIATVAVYSDADADALHVRLADEAIAIGGSASSESYLVIEKILDAIKQTGAQAVHPGYGFLSENATFAEKLAEEGIIFIGPGVKAIAAMGDKIESKKIAAGAGVNTVPGYVGVLADDKEAVKVAAEIGFPVMIKASAGGGGKGMRVAFNEKEVKEGFRAAVSEAASSFGDDRVFIEKFIEDPRHIEIQIIADSAGNTVYLGERECSIQRRHQKVIEEAPSPFLDSKTREAMGEQAVLLAKSVDYKSAGTVEFIVDKNKNFYFLEMNTRLQVEHPVTECITGLDLVELMIQVAVGDNLPIKQKDVQLNGWALETRVYAEDPYRNFLPSTGRLTQYKSPEGLDGVRIDTGVFEGSEISMFYDPMISKLITYGKNREDAIEKMALALDQYRIRGVNHNIEFLSALMSHDRFKSGELTTAFIDEEFPKGFNGIQITQNDKETLYAVAIGFEIKRRARNANITGRANLPRRAGSEQDRYTRLVIIDGNHKTDAKAQLKNGSCIVDMNKNKYDLNGNFEPGTDIFEGQINKKSIVLQVDYDGSKYSLRKGGWQATIKIIDKKIDRLMDLMPNKVRPDMSNFLLSPMPGLLVSVAVKEGDKIEAGQELAIVEAMKMENVMKAESDAIVAKIHATPGTTLGVDQPIIEFE
ncbi:MAG: acetyl/propionyl-CoA carboxylase subunit alpha [Rhodospirillaceae bacterium]|nr:acetyl/propionyl-CoA carboxylase subunit alpha [Rhodospirillaceae bacterium]OUU28142.1 MAG: acetyl/propionyl-CoA carboxylase subunit alpha [Candidatus Endolissoclinum sp. TMED37]